MEQLQRLRLVALRSLAMVSGLWTAVFAVASLVFPLSNVATGLRFSLAMTGLAGLLAWRSRYDALAAVLIAVAPALQPGVLVYLLDGHPWQMEGHMYFFAGLAAVSLACDWRPVLTATLLIAAHHLLLSWLAPAALFMGNHGHLDRVLIHAVAVLIVCALLTRTIGHLVRSFVDQEKTMAERDEAASLAQQERERCDVLQASRSAIAVRP